MPLLIVQPVPISTGPIACASTARPAAAAHDDDGHLFDDLVLGYGGDDKTSADADDPARKLEWLRSQVIGADAEFASPFGTRRVTYAGPDASGRYLRFVEDFVQRNVLPYYGACHLAIWTRLLCDCIRRENVIN